MACIELLWSGIEACAKATADAATADVAESEEPLDSSFLPPFTMDA